MAPTLRTRPGRLIVMEGLDGVGKTTQAQLLAANLRRRGWPVVLTQEPTAGPFGQRIRQLRRGRRQEVTPREELALFLADRREHVQQVILPALAAGKIVIADRYYYSSMAYQGALGLDPGEIAAQHDRFAPEPDLVILLELSPGERNRRLAQRGTAPDSFEEAGYLAKVKAIYDRLHLPQLCRIDASGSETEVQARILAQVLQCLNQVEVNPADQGERVP